MTLARDLNLLICMLYTRPYAEEAFLTPFIFFARLTIKNHHFGCLKYKSGRTHVQLLGVLIGATI